MSKPTPSSRRLGALPCALALSVCALSGCAFQTAAERAAPLPTPASLTAAQRAEVCKTHRITSHKPSFWNGGVWTQHGKKYSYSELQGNFLAYPETRKLMGDFQRGQFTAFWLAVLAGGIGGAGVGYGVNELTDDGGSKGVGAAATAVGAAAVTGFLIYMIARDDPRDRLADAFNAAVCAPTP